MREPVDEPANEELICFRHGLPIDERLSHIDEEPRACARRFPATCLAAGPAAKDSGIDEHASRRGLPLLPGATQHRSNREWSQEATVQGRTIQKVTFTSFEGLRVKATYSLPASSTPAVKLPAVLIVDHRKGIPVWGNEQPWERNQWGDRAVLIVETLDRGSRALEQNLRSFSDDDLLHHMKRQAMVAGTTLESMQVYEVLRSLDLLRSLPHTSIQPGSRSSARVRMA